MLEPVMRLALFTRVDVRRPDLRSPFPAGFGVRLTGQSVLALTRRAKYLLAELSSGDTLVMHLGMSGSFRVSPDGDIVSEPEEPGESVAHDHVVFEMSNGAIVTFNDPRRFGSMDIVPRGQMTAHPVLGALGPEPLSAAFDATALALACRGKKTSLKAALLDQRVVAGLGNIYVSEALHRAGLSPQRQASTLATPSGKPRLPAHRLAAAIKQVLAAAIERKEAASASYRTPRFRVYDREGQPCRTRRCGGTIRRSTQAGRSTFYCPRCQH
jgi:formamidopyrimidine-DNA glycosylase